MVSTVPRRRAAVTAALLALSLLSTSVISEREAQAAVKDDRALMRKLINRERVNRGIKRVRLQSALNKVAQRHSRRMASAGRLFHNSNLAGELSHLSWRVLGENVGVGTSIRSLHRAFMKSSAHRRNILDRRFKRIGVGVVRSGGRTWVTVVFKG